MELYPTPKPRKQRNQAVGGRNNLQNVESVYNVHKTSIDTQNNKTWAPKS